MKDPESSVQVHRGDNQKDESHSIVLLDSKETQIIAYMDQTTPSKPGHVNYTCEYSSAFVLGDRSHRGLGFDDESKTTPSGIESCTKKREEQEGACSDLSPSEKGMDADYGNNSKVEAELYTRDMSEKTDEDYDGESLDDESSGLTDQEEEDGVYGSYASEILFDDDSDVDEEVAEDYLEGIGGEGSVLDTKWLVGQALDELDADSSSSSSFDVTLEKLGGVALHASREYGMQKYQSRKKYSGGAKDAWSPALDDLMLVKDPITVSATKKHVARFPQSWPLQEQKSKNPQKFPGERKKHYKEMIAVKRRVRMRSWGVNLEQINLVSVGAKISCNLPPVKWMPGFWQEKLIGAGDEDTDFAVNEGFNIKALDATGRTRSQKIAKGSGLKKANSSKIGESKTVEVRIMDSEGTTETSEHKGIVSSARFGAFEVHTKGFGSKMMAKMGFVEGGGLGKDGQGMAQPIEVIQRTKSLGLGVNFSNTNSDSEMVHHKNSGPSENGIKGFGDSSRGQQKSFGAFEKHTKGLGSKMMAKMGFV
ncbi:hypothetical protein REPUB_Repub18cG0062200 [Reevesia pubescens]